MQSQQPVTDNTITPRIHDPAINPIKHRLDLDVKVIPSDQLHIGAGAASVLRYPGERRRHWIQLHVSHRIREIVTIMGKA